MRLCTACRVLRLQPVPPGPGFTHHFALFALVSAGRAQPSHGFEIEALREHVAIHRSLLAGLDPEVRLTDVPRAVLEAIDAGIVGGGLTDWTQRLLSNRKERLFTSGIGLSLPAQRFSV